MEVKNLALALGYAKTCPDAMGYTILKDAVERFLSVQNKAYPQSVQISGTPKKVETPKQQPQPSSPDLSEFIERVRKMKETQPKGCPKCGIIGPHYCVGQHNTTLEYIPSKHGVWVGPSVGTGIEYLQNQPTAISNFDTHPRRNEILEQVFGCAAGAQKSFVGAAKGVSDAHFTGSGRVTESCSKI